MGDKRGGWDTVIQPVDKTPYPTEQTQWSPTAAVKIHPIQGYTTCGFKPACLRQHTLSAFGPQSANVEFFAIKLPYFKFLGAKQLLLAFLEQNGLILFGFHTCTRIEDRGLKIGD